MNYYNLLKQDEHHRYRSWEHCYNFFGEFLKLDYEKQLENKDIACLNLAFYLASWGMMRGGSFLLQKDYLIHKYFIEKVVMNKYNNIFRTKDIKDFEKHDLISKMDMLIYETRFCYTSNIKTVNGKKETVNLTDTLVSKILLGVYGCVPAYDRYFISGLKKYNISSQLSSTSLNSLVGFYIDNIDEFTKLSDEINSQGVFYPPMKLIDMYFWQIGYDLDVDESYTADNTQDKEEIASPHIQEQHIHNIATTMNQTEFVRQHIIKKINKAREDGKTYLELVSGDIHKELGLRNRMPTVCSAMETIDGVKYDIVHNTPSGKSSTKKIRYYL